MGCEGTASTEDWCSLETQEGQGLFANDANFASAGQ